MHTHPFHRGAKHALICGLTAAALSACGGGTSVTPLPQLTAAQPAAFTGDCTQLQPLLTSLANTTITAATTVPAGLVSNVTTAEHCRLVGKMNQRVSAVDGNAYYIGFEIRMPKAWNGRFFYQANGGTDGSIGTASGALGGGPITTALAQGFAVLSSDAGHQSQATPFFGLDPQARVDYGYNAVAQLTPMAKSLIKLVYGKGPDRSYFGGCSNGGRHAMVAAARYSDQYDGIIAGDAGFNLPKAAVAQLWGVQQFATVSTGQVTSVVNAAGLTSTVALADVSTSFTPTELNMVSSKILAKCDALDGVVDNWVGNTSACQAVFNLATDVPTCSGARDGTCLSSAQKNVLASVHSGARNSSGSALYTSFPFDSGISTTASSGWASWKFVNSTGLGRDPGAMAFIFTSPPQSVTSTFVGLPYALNFNVDTDAPKIFASDSLYTESSMSFMTPPNPGDMSKLRNRGAKLIAYHGTADPVFSLNDTINLFKGLDAANSGDASNFARLFQVPGMAHCSGGPTVDQFDVITPMVNWVENGVAPASIAAAARGTGTSAIAALVNTEVPASWAPNRTRPLCPWPSFPTYKGTGSVDLASSFSCGS